MSIKHTIQEYSKFLNKEECKWFIEYHKKNFLKLSRELNYSHNDTDIIKISNIHHEEFRYLQSRLCYHIKKDFDYLSYPNYFEIVKWGPGTFQGSHQDFDYHPFTSIIYLNDNFEGGETVVEKTKVIPKTGLMITFGGSLLNHKVLEITKGFRYTIPVWYVQYKRKDPYATKSKFSTRIQ